MNAGGQAYLAYRSSPARAPATCRRATSTPTCGWPATTAGSGRSLGQLRRSQRRRRRCRPRRTRHGPEVGIDVTGGGSRRLAGARRRIHRSDLGAPGLRRHGRHPAAGQPQTLEGQAAARAGRRVLARRRRLRRGRGRLPPAARSGGKLGATRVMVNADARAFAETRASAFTGATPIDGGAAATPGPPSVSVDRRRRASFLTALLRRPRRPDRRRRHRATTPPERGRRRLERQRRRPGRRPRRDRPSRGGRGRAWKGGPRRAGTIGIHGAARRRRQAGPDRSAPSGGGITEPAAGGSGLGDAAIGFLQGTGAGAQIGAAVVDAPPDRFRVQPPRLRAPRRLSSPGSWRRDAIGGVTLRVTSTTSRSARGSSGHVAGRARRRSRRRHA